MTRRETFTNLSDVWAKEVELYLTNKDCVKMLVGNKVDRVSFLFSTYPQNFDPRMNQKLINLSVDLPMRKGQFTRLFHRFEYQSFPFEPINQTLFLFHVRNLKGL